MTYYSIQDQCFSQPMGWPGTPWQNPSSSQPMNRRVHAAQDQSDFAQAMRVLEAEIYNIGTHLAWEGQVRQLYALEIQKMSRNLEGQVRSGTITWQQAAQQANETRNTIMEIFRTRSTPVGRAAAENAKKFGKTLNTLIAQKTQDLYGSNAFFDQLSHQQKNNVYKNIILSSGKPNPEYMIKLRRASYAGRGLLFLSLGVSVYNIATADDKWDAAGREVAVTGAGIAGGIGGGAVAGLACGPGAPVCVTIGALLGGALAAFGMDMLW